MPYVSSFGLIQPRADPAGAVAARVDGIDWAADEAGGRLRIASLHPEPVFDLRSGDLAADERGSGFLSPAWREHLALDGLEIASALGVGVLPPPPRLRPAVGVVAGRELLLVNGLRVGDEVTLVGPDPNGGPPPRERAVISDTIGTGLLEIDQHTVFAPLPTARRLFGLKPGEVQGWRLAVRPGHELEAVRAVLTQASGLRVSTWREQRGKQMLRALEQQRRLMTLVMILVQALVLFIIFAVFSTLVVEKRRDLGVLRGLGAPARSLAGAFLGAGVAASLIGGLAGWLCGWGALWAINPVSEWLGVPLFPQDVFYTAEAPVSFDPMIPLFFIASQTAIGLLAVAIPAWRAARVDPIAVLRDEG